MMRVTVFTADGDDVAVSPDPDPALTPMEEFQGRPLTDVDSVDLHELPGAQMQLVRIAAGGHFVMHATPEAAFCQIVRGRGVLGLPGGREVPYQAPELYVFEPHTAHDWHDVEEDTLLSVCLLDQP